MGRADIRTTVAELSALYPAPEAITDPFEQVLWDLVGYLIDDERRTALFGELDQRVGRTPTAMAAADDAVLLDIASRGGMRPLDRVARWREAARIAIDAGGDLRGALAALPPAKGRALLKRFPTVADPAADRILLFAGLAVRPALESNGLRTLVRLGLSPQMSSYGATYRAAVERLACDGEPTRDWLVAAYHALRAHGRALCRRAAPECLACPLDGHCAHAPVAGL
jgi:endonuclease III